ncbi:DUF6252 family protein [Rubricoccus marinus]|uniref:Uncharacterized protein n=1 Tax=Rubricoccus marinus TaxID=716817 RepID=A0A259TWC0_9BACT|nr:DUF6252 family protein [Rubricoccus marinus]OZC02069.1 hypothetical protein BSZ36_03160 [Rubricoccus marinus]
MPRLLLLLAFALAFSGCSIFGGSDDSDCGSGDLASGSLSATVAGNAFDAVCVQGQLSSGALAIGGNLGATEGGSQKQINITLPGAQAGQTYQIGALGTATIATYSELSIDDPTDTSRLYTAAPGAGSGSITVDAVSASGASGSFEFTARNSDGQTVAVTGGRFDIDF